MTTASIYQPPRASPTALAVVVLLHGTALTALALAKMDSPIRDIFGSTKVIEILPTKPPPPVDPQPPKPHVKNTTSVPQIVPIPPPPSGGEVIRDPGTIDPGPIALGTGTVDPVPIPPPPAHIPVKTAAHMASGVELKPDYPISEQRAGTEGSVTLRVLVGTDGRVKAAEKVRATNDAFYQATLRHALRNWRFKPATEDGRPVESRVVLTVHFELDGDA